MADERCVGELLDELFGFESVAKRQTALEQYDRGGAGAQGALPRAVRCA